MNQRALLVAGVALALPEAIKGGGMAGLTISGVAVEEYVVISGGDSVDTKDEFELENVSVALS